MRLSIRNAARLSSQLKELRLHMCQNDGASKGARDFVDKYYPALKKDNPSLPILIRECSGVQPRLWARYDLGRETSISLTNQSAEEVAKQVEKLGKGEENLKQAGRI